MKSKRQNALSAPQVGRKTEVPSYSHFTETMLEGGSRLQSTLDRIMAGEQIIGYDWRYLYVNEAAARHGRRTVAELLGRTMMEAYPGFETTKVFAVLNRCMSERVAEQLENEFEYPDGRKGWFQLNIEPVPEGLFILSLDITDHKGAQEEVANLAKFSTENPNPVLRISAEGTVLYANDAGGVLLQAWDCGSGKPLPEEWRAQIQDVLASGRKRETDADIDGRSFILSLVPIPDAHYVNIYGRDMTELRRAQNALRASEERFRIVSQSVTNVIWEWDIVTKRLDWFGDIDGLLGYAPGEFPRTIKAWEAIIDPEDLDRVMAALDRHLKANEPYDEEYRVLRKDGDISFWRDQGVALRNERGDVTRMIGSVMDVTDRRRAQEEAYRAAKDWQITFDAMNDAVWILDADQRIVRSNKAAETLFHRRYGELIGKFCWEVVHGTDKPIPECPILRARQSLRRESMELQVGESWFDVTVDPVLDESGRYAGAVHIVSDITQRKGAEEKLRLTQFSLERASDGVLWIGEDAKIRYANEAACRHLGYTREELTAMSVSDIDPDYAAEVWPNHWRELRRKNHMLFESRHRRKNGQMVPVEISIDYLEFEGQAYNFASFRDISDRKRTHQALADEATRRRILVEQSRDGIVVLDRDGKVYEANKRYAEMLGYSPEEVRQLHIWDWDAKWTREELLEQVRNVDETGDHFETQHRRKDGSILDVEISTNGAVCSGRKLVFCVCRDITERKRVEKEKAVLQEQLRQAEKMEAIGHLAGGVAHDFNNLLTSIAGNAQLLSMHHAKDPKAGELVGEILKSSNRAADLTRQLLAFSRKGQLQSIPVNLHDVITDVLDLLSHSLDRGIEIIQRLEAHRPIVKGDPTLLQSAFLNLAINARDAMPRGGVLTIATREVQLNERQCAETYQGLAPGRHVEISVADTGVGMDSEVQEHLFEPFFTTKQPGRGTGLGLAGVYGCVQSHEGHVFVTSQIGRGTTMTILLPMSESETPAFRPTHSKETVKGKGRILVVDDEEDVRNFLVHGLEVLGYTVQACGDGVEAVEFFRRNHEEIDLVILDLIMPKLDGQGAFREMRRIDPQARILIASGFTQLRATNELLQEGALGFVDKPFRVERLSQDLARYIAECKRLSPSCG